MKKEMIITILVIFATVILVYALTRSFFLDFAADSPLIAAFIKFFFLASIGDFVGYKLKTKTWQLPKNILPKAFIWGLIGIVISLMFTIYPAGITVLMDDEMLPFKGSEFFFAFFVSAIMNLTFAPVMMGFHRITDTFLNHDIGYRSKAVQSINWNQFINVTVLKVIPLFWIPAHMITFLLPIKFG